VVEQPVVDLDRPLDVAATGFKIGQCAQGIVRFDLAGRVRFQLLQAGKRSVQTLAGFGGTPDPKRRPSGPSQPSYFIAARSGVVLTSAKARRVSS